MTDEQADELGRRLFACDGFRWMPGMLDTFGDRCVGFDRDGVPLFAGAWYGAEVSRDTQPHPPDMRDPSTRGCVLALVRERWPLASVSPYAGIAPDLSAASRWRVRDARGRDLLPWNRNGSEVEALVAALEAAS